MTFAPLVLQADWQAVREALTEVAASHDETTQFLSDLFGQLDALWADLLRRQNDWRAEEERARRELAARAAESEQERAELAAQRQRLRDEVERRVQQESQGQPESRGTPQDQSTQDQERIALETELEVVRARTAELTETLAQQNRQVADERAQWHAEFKQMRCLLESLVRHQAASAEGEPRVVAPPEARAAIPRPRAEDDPILSSVAAQFEMLQNDLSRRRKPVEAGT